MEIPSDGISEDSRVTPLAEGQTCVSCGGSNAGKFCLDCGEKKRAEHDYSAAHFLQLTFETLVHADSRLFRTVRFLISRQGVLTQQFMLGRWKPYLSPIQLFVVINLLFLVVNAFSVLLAPSSGAGLLQLVAYRSSQRDWTDILWKEGLRKRVSQLKNSTGVSTNTLMRRRNHW
jgi:hypothetical protein